MNDKPNMYGVLPANVRYHEGLSNFAKIIFTEVNALSNKNGYCHASNSYFEKVFAVSTATVTRALTELAECGAIKIKDGAGGESLRKITPCPPSQKLLGSVPQKCVPPLLKNEEQNNTRYNTTSLDTKVSTEPRKLLPLSGASSLQRLVGFYSALWRAKYGTSPTVNFPRAGKTLKPLLESHGEYKVALLLVQYFKWQGATGNDEFLVRRLESSTYPLYWIDGFADAILAYIRNVVNLDVDSPKQVELVVDKKIDEMGIRVHR